jgi:hypothetical protein
MAALASWTNIPFRVTRSVKVNEIGEGTNEVQRMVEASLLGC